MPSCTDCLDRQTLLASQPASQTSAKQPTIKLSEQQLEPFLSRSDHLLDLVWNIVSFPVPLMESQLGNLARGNSAISRNTACG